MLREQSTNRYKIKETDR